MDVKIGKLSVGLFSPTLSVENFKLYNTAEFGGSPFVQMPDLYIEYDRAMARRGRIHLKLVRVDVAEISFVKNKKGRYNFSGLDRLSLQSLDTNQPVAAQMHFAGIDTLNLTLRTARFSTVDSPDQERVINLGIKNQILSIKTEKDLKVAALILDAKSGGALTDVIQTLTGKGPKTGTTP